MTAPGPAHDRAAAEVAPQPAEVSDYMAAYHDFWAELVETDGRLDLDKVARELFDFRTLMDSASSVYSELANLSKPLTAPHVVIGEANRRVEEIVEDAVREETSELVAELDRQRVIVRAAEALEQKLASVPASWRDRAFEVLGEDVWDAFDALAAAVRAARPEGETDDD